MALGDITTDSTRTAFAQYAKVHEPASIQRCWSTWKVLCTFLYTAGLIAANPMPLVGRPKIAKTLPKALPADSVSALSTALNADPQPRRRSDWTERDRALILTGLLAGLRADELVRANIGDLRGTNDGAVIHVRGKGGKDRRIPIESALVDVIEQYLDSRATRSPGTAKQRSSPGRGMATWLLTTVTFRSQPTLTLAKYLIVVINGLSTRARDGATRGELRAVRDSHGGVAAELTPPTWPAACLSNHDR